MKKSIFSSLATAAKVALTSIGTHTLEVGEKAPLFEAPSTQGVIRMGDFLGKKHIVLAFYFADFTPT